MNVDMPSPRALRWLVSGSLCAGLALAWLVDLAALYNPDGRWVNWMPVLAVGPLAAAGLLPVRRPGLAHRAGAAAALSLATTAQVVVTIPLSNGSWGLLETGALLALLVLAVRRVERPGVTVLVVAALAAAVIAQPLRMSLGADTLTWSFLLTFAVGAAVGLGCYLRLLDARRARAVAAARHGERLELARDLHDFVAHHITGIIVQANAALAIHESTPEQVQPILETIARAGSETLDSMRRLVRVLREEEHRSVRPGEMLGELAHLVSAFSGDGGNARLEVTAAARGCRLAPEVETSVHRVVQEALTNVRRHAPGSEVTVSVDADGDRFRVEVVNRSPATRAAVPAGGRGGFGIVGLRERLHAVDGTLTAGPTPDGGWRLAALFPVLSPVEGSAA
ncbi:sensor histidine kinase [Microtetraspora malaysiensis]|uniref:sensor histidine kinase n=1 Tax=Microtetraspora malaysiensis TaxID=161358 RepID=UPI003D925CCF